MVRTHVKTGDDVVVISGKWKGESAKVQAVLSKKNRVVLEMTGLSPAKQRQLGRRTVKKSPDNQQGGLVERSVSVHISNVALKKDESKAASSEAKKSE